MTKVMRSLLVVGLVGIGLGAALLLAGCDEEAAADAAAAKGIGTVSEPATVATVPEPVSEPDEAAPGVTGVASGEVSILALSVDELIRNTAAYTGQQVVVRGTILTQCIRGCKFSLDDGTGVVNIELVGEAEANLLMHGSVGRIVEVRGVVEGMSRPLILVEDRDGWSYVD